MSQSEFTVYPAVDIAAGVLAAPSGAARASVLGDSPAQVLEVLADSGARWVHLVDLDRARGTGSNDEAIKGAIAIAHARGLMVQLSGGVHNATSLKQAIGAGADRVNLACESLNDPEWLPQVLTDPPCDLNICLDVRGERLIARGSGIDCGDLDDALAWLAAFQPRLVVTDIDADGALSGPPLTLLEHVASRGFEVIASGGVRDRADLQTLRARAECEVSGAIVGAALHAGRLALSDCYAQ